MEIPKNLFNLLVLFSIIPISSFAQNCEDCRYLTEIFDSVQVTKNIKFAEGVNAEGNMQELFLDVYQPVGDTVKNRPVLLFAFGGAFLTGSKEEGYVKYACERYAKAGYVAAAMDYRIGINFFNPVDEAMRVFFRAMQDLRASVEYFYYTANNGNPYSVDTNLIFLGGASAGAITALFVEYCDTPEKIAELGDTTKLAPFGGFYASSSIFPRQSRNIAGVVNVAGALTNADWVEAGKAPHISAHGDQDGTVPYKDDNQLNVGLGLLGIKLEGSYLIDQRAKNVGLCSYLYTIVGGDHPSGSAPPEYLDDIFNRWMPRMHAVINDRTFCCALNSSLEITGDTEIFENGDSIELDAKGINFAPDEYKWCSLPCSGFGNQQYLTSTTDIGQYWIAIAYDNSCEVTDFVRISEKEVPVDTTFIYDLADNPEIQMYPNPVSDYLVIKTDLQWEDIRIYDSSGKLIMENKNENPDNNQYKIQVSHLPIGNYILLVKSKNDIYSARFVKQD